MVSNVNSAPGVYGNIKDLTDRIQKATRSRAAFVGGARKGAVNERVFITNHQNFYENFGQADPDFSPLHYCVDPYLYQSSACYVTRVINGALWAGAYLTVDDPTALNPQLRLNTFTEDGSSKPKGKDDPINTEGFDATQAGVENVLGFFVAVDPGAWNNKIVVKIRPSNPSGVPLRGSGHDTSMFYVDVYYDYLTATTPPVESWLVSREQKVDGMGNQTFIDEVLKSSEYIRFKSNPHCPLFDMVTECDELFLGGHDGLPPTHDQIAEAWELYEDPEQVTVNLLVNCGYASPVVHHRMNTIATQRLDAMAILDLPSDKQDVSDAISYKLNELNLSSEHSAIYASDVLVYDKQNDLELYVPCSGYIASRYAYTDDTRAEWFAPAGLDRGSVSILGTRVHYDQGARDALFDAQVNPIRKMPEGLGYCIWEQQTTLTRASSLRDVNVVRLSKMILVSSMLAMRSKLFDPNDDMLRAFLKQMADEFMQPIKEGQGVYTYINKCDRENNPDSIVANGDVVIDQMYEPVIGVRRVHVIFNINKTGSTFTG